MNNSSKISKRLQCLYCSKMVSDKGRLKIHIRFKHPQYPLTQTSYDDLFILSVKPTPCDPNSNFIDFVCHYNKCNTNTHDLKEFKEHIKQHSMGRNRKCLWDDCTSLVTYKKLESFFYHLVHHITKNVIYCPFKECRQMFGKQQYLPHHLKRVHLLTKEKTNEIINNISSSEKLQHNVPLTKSQSNVSHMFTEPKQILSYKKSPEAKDIQESNFFDFNRLVEQWYVNQEQVSQKNKHTLDVENTINKTLCKDVEKKDLHIELNQENIDKMINELDVMQTDLIAMKNEKFTLEEQLNEIFSFMSPLNSNIYQKKIRNYKQELIDIENIIYNFSVNKNFSI